MKYGIVVPTMGLPHLVTFTQSLVDNFRGKGHVVFSFNVKDAEQAEQTYQQVNALLDNTDISHTLLWCDQPLGFGGACNQGLTQLIKDTKGDFSHVIFANDDLVLTPGWVQGLQNAHRTKRLYTDSLKGLGKKPVHRDELGGPIGIVGPCSTQVSGVQNVANEGNQKALKEMGITVFAQKYMMAMSGQYLRADFLSGFCISVSKDCLNELATVDAKTQDIELFDERFLIGGFEDNDLCVRATQAGFQLVVALDTYVHHNQHSTFKTYFQDAQVGLHNRLRFYQKWAKDTQKNHRLIAAYRVAFKCVNDLAQFGSSIRRAKKLGVVGAGILLTNDATEFLSSFDSNLLSQLGSVEQDFAKELAKLIDTDDNSEERKAGVLKAFSSYLDRIVANSEPFGLAVELSDWQSFNERDERNKTHELAEKVGADWIISIDADEILEDRLTSDHLARLMRHPDPLVGLYHTGWINHWETMNLVRTDPPFTSGRDLRGGMSGPRIWRVKTNSQKIASGTSNGLHCGNAPEYSALSARVAGVRFRHLSHVRKIDRLAKKQFYDHIDKDKDPIFIGGSNGNNSYAHISQSDNVTVELYNPANGLASFMLCYEDENVEMIAQKLDTMYAVSDELILVWTGDWSSKEEMEKFDDTEYAKTLTEPKEWFEDGPSYRLWALAKFFGVKWIQHKFDNEIGLSSCRNAAIEYTRQNLLPKGISWMQFLDPDEMPIGSNHEHNNSVRRCIEQNDCWGMMFTYKNKLPPGSTMPFSTSQSVRLFRVDPKGIMRFDGRAHETLEHSYRKLSEEYGINPNVRAFPIKWINLGLSGDETAMAAKLRKYTEMIVKDLNADPINPQAWLSLGLQYINEKDHEKAEICIERACMVAGDAFMPFKEMAVIQLNKALGMMLACKQRLNGSERVFWKSIDDLIAVIQQGAPAHPIINTGEENIIADIPLPSFPYERIVLSEEGEFLLLDEPKTEE